jgi:hypothetical protein
MCEEKQCERERRELSKWQKIQVLRDINFVSLARDYRRFGV